MSLLDPQTVDTLYKIGGLVGSVVVATVFIMRELYERERHQDPLMDMAREIRDYIICIQKMREQYLIRLRDSTSEDDSIFFRRTTEELDENLDSNRRLLLDAIDRITRGRPSS